MESPLVKQPLPDVIGETGRHRCCRHFRSLGHRSDVVPNVDLDSDDDVQPAGQQV